MQVTWLEPGMDADVVVARGGRADVVVAGGRVVVDGGEVAALPGRMVCTRAGADAVAAAGIERTMVEGGW